MIMIAKSKMQRKGALVALSVKKGEQNQSVLKGASKKMFADLNLEELVEMTRPRRLVRHLT